MTADAAAQLWQEALHRLQSQVTPPNFETWLRGTIGLRLESDGGDSDTFVVGARSDFVTEWLSMKLRPTIRHVLGALDRRITDVIFEVSGPIAPEAPSPDLRLDPIPARAERSRSSGRPDRSGPPWPRPRLNARFTFDSYVVGGPNRLAHSAAMAVASSPGAVYNPLVIFGAAGLGKTHLLHAIAGVAHEAGARLSLTTAEGFTNEYATASRERRWDDFRRRYRGADLLLIDDLQFLSGKEQTLRELCHTFDELHGSSRQVVLVAERRPAEIASLERLAGKLQAGLCVEVQAPNLQLRIAILHAKSKAMGLTLSAEVLELIASSLPESNVCDLEGCLHHVAALARLSGKPPTADTAVEALKSFAPEATQETTPETVLTAVCERFQVSRQLLAGKTRDSRIAFARHVAMYLLREEARCTLNAIGRELGDRDHSTVLYGCSKISRELDLLAETRTHVESLQRSIRKSVA